MQETLRSLQQQSALYASQLEAQRHETRAAQEMLSAAEADMEGLHYEKKQLVAQWRSSVAAVQRCGGVMRGGGQRAMREGGHKRSTSMRPIPNPVVAHAAIRLYAGPAPHPPTLQA